ncbi:MULTISPECIES: hypothetical protein [unclassified Methylobacterium]|uniref:hypothetical protein n=1 Tax=unclassified Methylobacterium TaxID=2615210 RepID=UPI001FB8D5E1|nr:MULTISPECIES: hypothetical protein [unclassified Methylobacterium]MCJ2021013.1 hypothetical protein [Methylobacterium sp. E-065]
MIPEAGTRFVINTLAALARRTGTDRENNFLSLSRQPARLFHDAAEIEAKAERTFDMGT